MLLYYPIRHNILYDRVSFILFFLGFFFLQLFFNFFFFFCVALNY